MLKQKDYKDLEYFLDLLMSCSVNETGVRLNERDMLRLGILTDLVIFERYGH